MDGYRERVAAALEAADTDCHTGCQPDPGRLADAVLAVLVAPAPGGPEREPAGSRAFAAAQRDVERLHEQDATSWPVVNAAWRRFSAVRDEELARLRANEGSYAKALELAEAEIRRHREAIARVRAVHQEAAISGICDKCSEPMDHGFVPWPCDTVKALDGGA